MISVLIKLLSEKIVAQGSQKSIYMHFTNFVFNLTSLLSE